MDNLILLILLFVAVYYDITVRKIPNKVTVPAFFAGITWSLISSGLKGFQFSLLGFLVGFAVFFVPYLMNAMGAGDIKLMAAIGAIKGWEFIVSNTILTAIIGGVIAVLYMLFKKGFLNTIVDTIGIIIIPLMKILFRITGINKFYHIFRYFVDHKSKKENTYIPYAIPIALGSIAILFGEFRGIISF